MKETVIEIIGYVLVGMLLGALVFAINLSVNGVKESKPVQPTIQVECTGGVCDTTYVYKF